VNHPYLTRIPLSARRVEIEESRGEIERAVGRRVRYFAYPGGDYDSATLALVRNAGYEAALATVSKHLEAGAGYEVERVGIYSPPLWKVALKAAGVVPVARRLGFQVG
jgi:peptidoglycan/xylan/chitin deacetylase (PgdA/CDA1 family)